MPAAVIHNRDWGNRLVRLEIDGNSSGPGRGGGQRTLTVTAPAQPALAVPGYYLLFAVGKDGVPSIAARVHIPTP